MTKSEFYTKGDSDLVWELVKLTAAPNEQEDVTLRRFFASPSVNPAIIKNRVPPLE